MRDPIDRSEKFTKLRRPSQRFVFTLWEPPTQTPDLKSYDRFFNWTMTYRFDSHVFAPYYFATAYRLKNNHWFEENLSDYRRDEEKVLPYENIPINRKKGTAVALISNVREHTKRSRPGIASASSVEIQLINVGK